VVSLKTRKKPQPSPLRDIGTLERPQHDTLVLEETAQAGKVHVRVMTQQPHDRYLQRKEITDQQWAALDQFISHWHAAGKGQRITGSYAERTMGGEDTESTGAVHANREIKKALRALDYFGKVCSGVVIHVAMGGAAGDWAKLTGQPGHAGLITLRIGANVLADHFGV
jgi:hypothetical protein